MTKITLKNDIRIEHPGGQIARALIDKYTVPNPDFYKREAMGKWTGDTPQDLALWQRDGNTLILPYGAMADVVQAFRGQACVFSSEASKGDTSHEYESCISLYPYQEKAVQAVLEAQKGILVAPCGSGKTQMGLELAARLGLKTLWLTHTHELLNQSMNRAKTCFDLPEHAFGAITAGKVEIGEVITFATVQTMVKLDLSKYADTWGCVIVDECHRVAGTPTRVMQFSKVIGSLNAAYKFGLTATPKRADGLVACMYAYLGPKAYEIDRSEVKNTTCPVKYVNIETGWNCDLDEVTNTDGTLDYVKLINSICVDSTRTKQVARVIADICGLDNARVLVLSERVHHLHKITEALSYFDDTPTYKFIYGNCNKAYRDEAIMELKAGKVQVLLATYQLAKEGLDIPELTHLVMASPNKTDVTITQSAGRVARACTGKKKGVIIDFVDDFLPLRTWAAKRARIYKKLGYDPQ